MSVHYRSALRSPNQLVLVADKDVDVCVGLARERAGNVGKQAGIHFITLKIQHQE